MNELTISSQPSTLSPATQLLDSILRVKQSWKILLVDDRAYFHKLTKVILKNFEFEGKPLEFISAYSGKEAEEIITANPDIAVILLDVVMETDHAGLKVVKYIRDQIKNKLVRIILRTGNPEEAPEESVIINYDINDYKTKGELSQKKLITTMVAALRSYRDVRDLLKIRLQLQDTNRQLEHKVKLRTQELEARNFQLQQEIQERQETEKALKKLKEELEIRVEQRTLELINLNQQLSQEIEVRNEIEITLRQQEEFLRSIWEGVDEIILVVDVLSGYQFRYVAFNPALERFKVMSGVQILGKTVEEALPPAMATIWTSHYQNCVEAGTTISFEERFEIEGQESWWLTSLSPLKDENNEIVQLIITATNISDRKQMEEALRSSEHKYRSLVENLSDGIYLIAADEQPIYFNPAIAAIFGRERDYLLAQQRPYGFVKCIHPEDLEMVRQSFASHPLEEDWLEVNYRIVTDSGEIRYLRDRRLAIRERDGKITAYQGIISDLTAIKQTQLALEQAKETADATNRAKSEFLANMSHEIRTPMNAILGFCELLKPLITESEQHFYLQSITASGRTLLALIDDILDLSRIEAGKLKLHYESVNLRRLIEEVLHIFSARAAKKNLSLLTEIDPNLPRAITFDEVRLRQILFNVVGNALKFTEVGEIKITVKTKSTSKEKPTITIQLTVEDTGIGIAREQQERVFDAFIQSEGQSTRKYGGTGLGLGITKRLTEILGGTVSLNSELGRGSTFTFIFPEVAIADEISSQESDLDLDEDLEQFAVAKVLVVDDVASNRHLIEGFFNQSKHILLMAEDGEEGIKLARQEKPDLILLDLLMPNLDGRSAAQELKQDRETKHIPIVILTRTPPEKMRKIYNLFAKVFCASLSVAIS